MLLLLANLAATGMMIGIIWCMQLVHYPLFARVGAAEFPAYEAAHQTRITALVGPWMALEAATAIALLWLRPPGVSAPLAWAGVALVGVLWLSTACWQGPLHARLARGFDPALLRRLVLGNWLRTAAWTARGFVVLAMAWQALRR